MRIYKCNISSDEVLCDNDRPLAEEDGVVYAVPGKYIEIGGEDFGLAANVDEDAGEGATGDGDDASKERILDIVHQNRLVETSFDKKSYMATIKAYMKKVKESIDDEEEAKKFVAGAQVFVKKVIGDFDEFQFFLGESMSDEGIVVLCKWEGESCTFYFWKHGLKGEKV